MENKRQIDTRDSIRVVTTNDFITACGLEGISLKARKLLYIAISQCKRIDTEFYEYEIFAKDFANMMNISSSHVYEESDRITDELMHGFIKIAQADNKRFKKYNLFSKCEYDEGAVLRFKINKDMTDFLLEVKGSFSKPLLNDFLQMKSPYSMAIWHLMQREMQSNKPYGGHVIEFDLMLDELRQVTGTQDKLKQLVHFKERILDKALREIKDNCGIIISYTNLKKGRTVIGFHFTAVSENYLPTEKRTRATRVRLEDIEQDRQSKEEHERLEGQLDIYDIGL